MDARNEQLSVLDTVTYGFKAAFKSLPKVSWAILPWVIIYAIADTAGQFFEGGSGAVLLFSLIVSWSVLLYMIYPASRTVRDIFLDRTKERYTFKRIREFFCCSGIIFAVWLGMIPVCLLTLVGLVFFIVPGLIIWGYYIYWTTCVLAIYLAASEKGVIHALKQSFKFRKGHFLRMACIGFLGWFIFSCLSGVMALPIWGMQFMKSLSPSMTHSLWFPAVYAIFSGISIWFTISVGHCGLMFMAYRYYQDSRSGETGPIELSDYQNHSPSISQQA